MVQEQGTVRVDSHHQNHARFSAPLLPQPEFDRKVVEIPAKEIINTCFYRKKEEFRQAVMQFSENIPRSRQELVTLMTLKFHILHSQPNF